ncbi:MAG: hypothetical protein LBU86_00750 [Oscillospiraceae bacterium]|jgi:hypothetical protein|nr:hypothetical protein [Oscillospiraceae bacterium]
MKVHIIRRTGALLLLAAIVCLCGCSSPKEPSAAELETLRELGQEFMDDLGSAILPGREDDDYLRSLAVMLSEEETVSDMSDFDSFVKAWEGETAGSLTVFFRTGASRNGQNQICARFVCEGGAGYYFRYEVPDGDSYADISVASRVFDAVEVVPDEALQKVKMKLGYGGEDIATFTFRPVPLPAEESGGDF